jgi:hypothetical protein
MVDCRSPLADRRLLLPDCQLPAGGCWLPILDFAILNLKF